MRNRFCRDVYYYDINNNIQYVKVGEIFELHPGKIVFLNGENDYSGDVTGALWGCSMVLPGNLSFNTDLNQYTAANYNFRVTYKNTNAGDPGSKEFQFNVGADTSIPTWWVRTETSGGEHGIVHDGISRDFNYDGTTYQGDKNNVTKMFFEQYGGELSEYHGYYE